MIILDGKTRTELTKGALTNLISRFARIYVDIGTGDGRFCYREARRHADTLYIGLDPVSDNMWETSVKASKKPQKGGVENVLFVVAAVENLPPELNGIADKASVLFPWGALLEAVVKPVESSVRNIAGVCKDSAEFEFFTTLSDQIEGAEKEKRELPDIDEGYFRGDYSSVLARCGLVLENVERYTNQQMKKADSQWAKRLAYGRERAFFRIMGTVRK